MNDLQLHIKPCSCCGKPASIEKALYASDGHQLAKAEEQPHWIPCSERLPEKNGKYLITGRQGAVNVLLFEDGRWYGRWGVVAWRELPEPYGDEDK